MEKGLRPEEPPGKNKVCGKQECAYMLNWYFLLFGAEEEPLELEKKLMVIQVRLAWLHIGSWEDAFGLGGHSRK